MIGGLHPWQITLRTIVCCGIMIYWVNLEMECQIIDLKLDLQAEKNKEMLAEETETYNQLMERHLDWQ